MARTPVVNGASIRRRDIADGTGVVHLDAVAVDRWPAVGGVAERIDHPADQVLADDDPGTTWADRHPVALPESVGLGQQQRSRGVGGHADDLGRQVPIGGVDPQPVTDPQPQAADLDLVAGDARDRTGHRGDRRRTDVGGHA